MKYELGERTDSTKLVLEGAHYQNILLQTLNCSILPTSSLSCHIAILPYCHISILPYFHIAIFPYCQIVIFSYYHIAIFPYCHISILPYFHIAKSSLSCQTKMSCFKIIRKSQTGETTDFN